MMANDGQSVYDLCIYTAMMIAGPIVAILIIVYIWLVLSPIALVGFLFFFSFYPLQVSYLFLLFIIILKLFIIFTFF